MKTNCLPSSFVRTALLFIASMLLGLLIAEITCAAPFTQQSKYSATPDPYFSGDSPGKIDPLPKRGNRGAGSSPPPTKTPSLWETPPTVDKPDVATRNSKPNVTWEAPLTDVRTADKGLNPTESNGFAPMKSSQEIVAPITPSTSANSIIREGNTGSNDFDINSFGSPAQALTSSNDKTAGSFSAGKPFEIVPQQQTANNVPENNSFSVDPSPQKTNTSPLENSNSFGSADSFDLTTEKPNRSQIAQASFDSVSNAMPSEPAEPNSTAESFEAGKVLALVGGEPIFVGDLLFDINQMIERFMPGAPEDVKEQERQKMIPQILPKFVESRILFLGTLRMLPEGAKVEDILEQASKEFDDKALDKMIKSSGLKSSSEFDANLRAMGSSLRQLRRSWGQDQLTKYFLSQQLKTNTEVTHQEMLDSYHKNIGSYAVPAKCRWEQVTIRFDRSSSRAAAKEAIVEIGNQIVYGANLAAVAKKSSHGFLASEGGQHDWTTKGALVLKEVDEAIFSLPVGELSDIIESRDGYHVIRVIERTEAKTKPFLEAQVEIKQRIESENRKQAFDKHVAKLKQEIPVEYFLNEDAEKSLETATSKTTIR